MDKEAWRKGGNLGQKKRKKNGSCFTLVTDINKEYKEISIFKKNQTRVSGAISVFNLSLQVFNSWETVAHLLLAFKLEY